MRTGYLSHYARILTACHGRDAHRPELEAMASWIESHWPKKEMHPPLPPAMLRRLEQIEAMPAAAIGEEPPPPPPPAPPSSVRAVLPVDQWAMAAHAWRCGCTYPSAGQCEKCAGSCLCHVGAVSTGEQREAV